MAEELFIPKLGQTVEEVTLVNWLVNDEDSVEQGQEVLEVETDKAIFNVEAVDKGIIHIGPFKQGDVVPVLTVVAVIGAKDDKFELKTPASEEVKPAPEKTAERKAPEVNEPPQVSERRKTDEIFVSPRAKKLANEKNVNLAQVNPTGGKGIRVRETDVIRFLTKAPRISPLARKMAADANLELHSVIPSGPRGEITRADVEFALARRAQIALTESSEVSQISLPQVKIRERIPLKGVRGVIAERMEFSARTTSCVTLLMDVDATGLVSFREKLKIELKNEWDFTLGYNDILARLCAITLVQFPYMNARLNSKVIEQMAEVNIGIAVDAERGLYVPVIRNVDQKNLKAVGLEFRQRVDEIRDGSISPDHLSGATFTITNLGMYDIEGFTPVINLPEAAILGVGKIIPKPVARDDQVVIRQMMTLSLAFDHRLIDGAPAARFMQALKQSIESPDEKEIMG